MKVRLSLTVAKERAGTLSQLLFPRFPGLADTFLPCRSSDPPAIRESSYLAYSLSARVLFPYSTTLAINQACQFVMAILSVHLGRAWHPRRPVPLTYPYTYTYTSSTSTDFYSFLFQL